MKKVSIFILSIFLFFFTFSIAKAETAQDIIAKYASSKTTGQKVNILVVPGHDEQYWGTEFNDIHEADVTVAIGQFLYNYLKADPRLNVIITRTQMGYTDTFKNYFANNREQIQAFIASSSASFKQEIAAGTKQQNEIVPHATANPEVAIRLYGINKWANENNIDLIIHIHVNDEGSRQYGQVGEYKGFSMYIPDKEYSNASTSAIFGKAIFNELIKKYPASNYPPEAAGLIPDQELIAIGAANTLKPAATLIEYGYIYEPQFLNVDTQDTFTKAYAYQTYAGVESFFGNKIKAQVTYLPHTWTVAIGKGSKNTSDVSSLQAALTASGVYSCGITGTFGPCTEAGVKAFQKKYKLDQTGSLGPKTRAKLNSLFGS
jgi:N-acetylmuramoyl-L-alanine amidase